MNEQNGEKRKPNPIEKSEQRGKMEAGALTAFPAIPAYSRHASFKVRAPPSTPFTSRSRHILINRRFIHEVRATTTATAGAIEPETRVQPNNSPADIDLFACPICYEPLLRKGPPGIKLDSIYRSGFKCRKCGKSFTSKDVYLDLTVTSGAKAYNEFKPTRTELFRNLALIRADVSRLPFASGSVDAVHAGAALHCWPSPSNAVAEISRVLRSGGVLVATTFLSTPLNTPFPYESLRSLRQFFGQVTNSYAYFTEKEIEDLCKSCGLVNYTSKVQRAFIMFSAQKP